MIGQDFNYEDSSIKDMTNFFETRVKRLEPKEDKKSLTNSKKKIRRRNPRREKVMTPTQVL